MAQLYHCIWLGRPLSTHAGDALEATSVDARFTMDVSATGSDSANAVQLAMQVKMLDGMKTQGAGVLQLLASAPQPGVNSPSQGHHIDAFA